MKRTPLKRKTPLKRTALKRSSKTKKKPKKPSIRILKDRLWKECQRLTRERWGNTCYTCDAPGLEGKNWQTGHGKAMAALPLTFKYDIRNLRPQCMVCNVHRGGMTDIFISKLAQEKEGMEFLMDACVEIDGAWYINQSTLTMGGRDATIFVEELTERYRSMSYER